MEKKRKGFPEWLSKWHFITIIIPASFIIYVVFRIWWVWAFLIGVAVAAIALGVFMLIWRLRK